MLSTHKPLLKGRRYKIRFFYILNIMRVGYMTLSGKENIICELFDADK